MSWAGSPGCGLHQVSQGATVRGKKEEVPPRVGAGCRGLGGGWTEAPLSVPRKGWSRKSLITRPSSPSSRSSLRAAGGGRGGRLGGVVRSTGAEHRCGCAKGEARETGSPQEGPETPGGHLLLVLSPTWGPPPGAGVPTSPQAPPLTSGTFQNPGVPAGWADRDTEAQRGWRLGSCGVVPPTLPASMPWAPSQAGHMLEQLPSKASRGPGAP